MVRSTALTGGRHSFCSGQENLRRASKSEEIGRRFTFADVFTSSSLLFIQSCQPQRRKKELGPKYEGRYNSIGCPEETCGAAAKLYDRRQRGSKSLQEVDPFCMASVMEDSSLGYLSKNCFMLRLELRIKSPANESVTLRIHRRIVFCEVSVERVLSDRSKGTVSVEHQARMGDESVYLKN